MSTTPEESKPKYKTRFFNFVDRHSKALLVTEAVVIAGAIARPSIKNEVKAYREMQDTIRAIAINTNMLYDAVTDLSTDVADLILEVSDKTGAKA